MAWKLSSWLVLTRTFQLVAALVAGSMNGFLIAWIYIKKLGLSNNMVTLEIMVCLLPYHALASVLTLSPDMCHPGPYNTGTYRRPFQTDRMACLLPRL